MICKLVTKMLFAFALGVASISASQEQPIHAESGSFSSKLELVRDFMIDATTLEYLGNQPVNSALDARIREILLLAGIKDVEKVRIRRFGWMGPRENACVFEVFGVKYVFVDEDWFIKLSIEEQDFIIAHETMHLKCDHPAKRMRYLYGAVLLPMIVSHFLTLAVDKDKFMPFGWSKETTKSVIGFTALVVEILGIYKTLECCRNQEFEADREAAKLLQTIKGGKELFKLFEERGKKIESEFAQWKLLKWKRELLHKYFSTHPSTKDRIKALEAIEVAN